MSNIYQVAQKASVSVATVSRVLSRPDVVRLSTRERVLRVIDELGYEPNRAAQTLRTLKAAKILVTVPDISNPFFSKIIRGAEQAARDAGYAVMLGDTRGDRQLENQYSAMLRRGEVDGLIFLGHNLPDNLHKLVAGKKKFYPMVNGCEFSPELPVSSVHIDNRRAGRDAVFHLHSLGHTRIGVVTGPLEGPLSKDRIAGVTDVANRQKLDVRAIAGDFSVESGFEATQTLLTDKRTAIFCFSDEMAIGALAAIRLAGLRCPRDVSVIGFDDIRFAKYASPSLTTIAQPTEEIGQQTVAILLSILRGELTEPVSITLPHKLVIRESTAAKVSDHKSGTHGSLSAPPGTDR